MTMHLDIHYYRPSSWFDDHLVEIAEEGMGSAYKVEGHA